MGVTGLWPLLEPVGRRIRIEALANKTLAVDASVWLFQFIKAMRDERGDLLRNAHLLGFFRRICRLLFHKIRPVFVFDGATPALKRQTTIARRRRREQQDAKLRKTAEKLLLTQLKKNMIMSASILNKANVSLDKKGGSGKAVPASSAEGGMKQARQPRKRKMDVDTLNLRIAEQPCRFHDTTGEEPGSSKEHSLPSSTADRNHSLSFDTDELLAAQLAAEGDWENEDDESTRAGNKVDGQSDDGDGDADTNIDLYLPQHGDLDPEVLSTLPPSLQLEIIIRAREQRVAFNRENFEKRSGEPNQFSAFQLQQYLKSSELRRQVEHVRSAVNIAASGGHAAKRIAADIGREYVLQKDEKSGHPVTAPVASLQCGGDTLQSENMDIVFDIPLERGDASDLEWEDVSVTQVGVAKDLSVPEVVHDSTENRDQARKKSQYWSLSHGFQKGRALGEWGRKPENVPPAISPDNEDDEAVQKAIEKSLQEKSGAPMLMNDSFAQPSAKFDISEANRKISHKENSFSPKNKMTATNPRFIENMGSSSTVLSSSLKASHGQPASKCPSPPLASNDYTPVEISVHDIMGGGKGSADDTPSLEIPISGCIEGTVLPHGSAHLSPPPLNEHKLDEGGFLEGSQTRALRTMREVNNKHKGEDLEDLVNQTQLANTSAWEAAITKQEDLTGEEAVTYAPVHEFNNQKQFDGVEVHGHNSIGWFEVGNSHHQNISDTPSNTSQDVKELLNEEVKLQAMQRGHRGQTDTPTSDMYAECQELLQMFGIPYIIAPMEAEAQCAWLDANGLVDGVITDDNDVFLFGGLNVYRNIFSSAKFVEEFHMADVERELGLSREKLTLLALLLGSDYTPGVQGVGIVNAVEIVNAFSSLEQLKEFKHWADSPSDHLVDNAHSEQQDVRGTSKMKALIFFESHKRQKRNWDIPESFPDSEVVQAYSNPRIDSSKDKFVFGRPDLPSLRSLCNEAFGWKNDKADELLLPVISSYAARQAQQTMDSFLLFKERFARIKSKRLQKALGSIKPEIEKDLLFDTGAKSPAIISDTSDVD